MQVGERTSQAPHVSLFRRRLARLAGDEPVSEWVVRELNRRGHLGAFSAAGTEGAPEPTVTLEELIVALAMPHAEADGRNWKLIVRALQKGPFSPGKLARLAKLERGEVLLAWLLAGLPEQERTPELEALAKLICPRDRRPPSIRYDFGRLNKRPASSEHLWRHPRD